MAWRILLAIVAMSVPGQAQTYRLRVDESDTSRSHGTACCVGHTDDGDAVLVTARHNLRWARTIEIRVGTRWLRCTLAASHPEADVAVLEAAGVRLKHFARIRPARRQERVAIGGYGGEYHGGHRREFDAIVLSDDTAVGVAGARPVLGDSGGFVAATTDAGAELLGIIIGWERDRPTHTAMEPARRIVECLQRRYRCGPAGCPPVWIRPGVTQPYVGPFPVGPPRPIGIVDPLPPIAFPPPPRPPVSDSPPDTGAGSPTQEQINEAVSAWLDAHADEIRGRDGRDGATGPAGPPAPEQSRVCE